MSLYGWLTLFFGLLITLAIVAVTLWITFRYPGEEPDFSEARTYLEEKAAMEHGAKVVPTIPGPRREAATHARAA